MSDDGGGTVTSDIFTNELWDEIINARTLNNLQNALTIFVDPIDNIKDMGFQRLTRTIFTDGDNSEIPSVNVTNDDNVVLYDDGCKCFKLYHLEWPKLDDGEWYIHESHKIAYHQKATHTSFVLLDPYFWNSDFYIPPTDNSNVSLSYNPNPNFTFSVLSPTSPVDSSTTDDTSISSSYSVSTSSVLSSTSEQYGITFELSHIHISEPTRQ